ncbi:hypothetical protein IEQ44_05925 [Nocardioides sp. Y6]|uniref:Uncharacterized protein n=1 Tax=Nocardioides malaquae TaxID=2773426 RepID=A0ABR9RRH9_9ACTN|nr:hypothetical protein [Nocardioides malaquae]MBE7324184.1 hypothetical protein [Nocardioides malaquae]
MSARGSMPRDRRSAKSFSDLVVTAQVELSGRGEQADPSSTALRHVGNGR